MNNAASQQSAPLLKTPLWALHRELGGKMVPFAGYDMPVQYDGMGVLKEHLHTRAAAGLFDVSHMGQAILSGDVDALEALVPSDIRGLVPGQMRYTHLLNDQGGIIDDLIVTRRDAQTLFIVVNAACKDGDFAHIRAKLAGKAELKIRDDRALIAVQGPAAEKVVAAHFPAAAALGFMTSLVEGDVFVSRCGYTGEDGFEISIPAARAEEFARILMKHDDAKWIGLGARDSLRLEAGLCLYGHDIDTATTPVEANLKWIIPKRRRADGGFPGANKIIAQITDGAPRLRIGLQPEGRAPLREGTELFAGGRKIGVITSGGFGPSVNAPVAMGYVETAFAAVGTKIDAMLRGEARPCAVAALPFIPAKYKKD